MDNLLQPNALRFARAIQQIRRKFAQDFASIPEMTLTLPQYEILSLVNAKGPCKSTALAEWTGVKPSAITVMVDKLTTLRLLDRQADPDDRRVVMVRVTEEGQQTIHQLRQYSSEMIADYLIACEPQEIEHMIQTLEKITSQWSGPSHRSVPNE